MTVPSPSSLRVVRIYSGAQMLATRGITPAAPLQWPAKHPLDADWWWVDATGWCQDIGDTIGQVAKPIPPLSDAALLITKTAISADGMQAGLLFSGGTPGAETAIRVVLTGAATGEQKSVDITMPIQSVAPVQPNPPNLTTVSRSVIKIGGIEFPIPQGS